MTTCDTCDDPGTVTGTLHGQRIAWCEPCWTTSVQESMEQSMEVGDLVLDCDHIDTVRLYRQLAPSQGRRLQAAARLCTRCLQPLHLPAS